MAFLRVNGWTIPLIDESPEEERELGGDFGRAFSGSPLNDERYDKRVWRGRTPPLIEMDAEAIRGVVRGLGHLWSFDSDLYSSKGLVPLNAIGSRRVGIAADGADVVEAYAGLGSAGIRESKFGTHSFTVEDATTNILDADQRDCEGDTTPFADYGTVTLSMDTTRKIQGSQSLKVACSGGGQDGVYTDFVSCAAATQYVASVYVYVTSGTGIELTIIDDDTLSTSVVYTLVANKWNRLRVSGTTGAIATQIRMLIAEELSATNPTFWIDALQIETGSITQATTWADPSRATGVTSYPPGAFARDSDFTVNFWARCPSTNPSGEHKLFFLMAEGLSKNKLEIYRNDGANDVVMNVADKDEGTSAITYSSSPWDGDWHMVTAVFRRAPETGENALELYFDGASVGTAAAPAADVLFSNVDTGPYFGGLGGNLSIGAGASPSLMDDVIAVPYAAPSGLVSAWYAMAVGMPPLSKVYVDGDIIPDAQLSVLAEGMADLSRFSAGHRSSAFRSNLRAVNIELWES